MSRRALRTSLDVAQRVIEAAHRGTITVVNLKVEGPHRLVLPAVDAKTHAWLCRLVDTDVSEGLPHYAPSWTRVHRSYGRATWWERFDVVTWWGEVVSEPDRDSSRVRVEWTTQVPHTHRPDPRVVEDRVRYRCLGCRDLLTHTQARELGLPTYVSTVKP